MYTHTHILNKIFYDFQRNHYSMGVTFQRVGSHSTTEF